MIGGGGAGIAVALNLFGSGGGGSDVVLVPNSRLFCLGTFLLPGTLRRLTVAKPAAAAGTLLASPAAAATASNSLVSRARALFDKNEQKLFRLVGARSNGCTGRA